MAAQPLAGRSYAEPVATWPAIQVCTINLLAALRAPEEPYAVELITSNKVFRNNESLQGYHENDPLASAMTPAAAV